MSFGNYPPQYLLFNTKLSKQLSLVLQIDGVSTLFGIADTFTKIRYGDQDLVYGLPGVVYGGLRSLRQVHPFIMLDSGLTIQQRIEPESGKGNIGVITINLIDYNGEVSKIISPGQVVPEIMGQRARLWIGYTDTSFPEDYVLIYQGQITQCVCPPGKVTLQISDSTLKARQPVFNLTSTTLIAPMDGVSNPATASMGNTGVLHQQILGPDGNYDPTVQTYIVVDSEIMQYAATGILDANNVAVTRPMLGTAISTHDVGATVNGSVGFGQNSEGINCIDLALKLLLSGWDGPCYTGVGIMSFVYDYNGHFVNNEFLLSTQDALLDLGLAVGDYFTVTGSASGNNLSGRITGFNQGATNRTNLILTDQTFTLENPTAAVVAFRSQYDTFPVTCGVQCKTSDVDVPTFVSIRGSYFSTGESNFRCYYDTPTDGQDILATDIMLPIGSYSISRYGRISMSVTKPPLPGAGQKLIQLDQTNVCDPDKIQVTRATNQRSFYNLVSYEFDFNVANNSFGAIQYFFDTASASQSVGFGTTVTLPIQAKNVSASLGGALLAQSRGTALLNRYKQCLIWIELTVNWSVGSLIEVSDIVVLVDNGTLQIMNFETGERNLGTGLFEVIDRNYQIASGNVKLKLLGGLGFDIDSRFGLYSPSSVLGSGSTPSSIKVTPSYGQTSIANEVAKWGPIVGSPIQVHSPDWSVVGQSVLMSSAISGFALDPPLGFTPPAGYILDIAPYPLDSNPQTDQFLKKLYAHWSPTVPVTGGISTSKFNVSLPSEIIVGNKILVRNPDYSVVTNEVAVESVSGSTVTLVAGLTSGGTPYSPVSGDFVEGIGFMDHLGFYRWG